jgi:hypothetical protein
MTETVMPVTPEVSLAANNLDTVIERFLVARRSIAPSLGKYESQVEALNLFNLVVRDVEAVGVLARDDLALLPAAIVLSRAAFEISVKAAWLVDVDDPLEGEVRWLAHLKEEERLFEQAPVRPGETGNAELEALRDFRRSVAAKLPTGMSELPGNPSFEQMLQSLEVGHLYSAYRQASQFAHGGHRATGLYRRNLGTLKQLGEFIEPSGWYWPLRQSFLSFSPARVVFARIRGDDGVFLTMEEQEQVEVAIDLVLG